MRRLKLAMVLAIGSTPALADSPPLRFERIVIDADFPGGYQVEVADVNGDQKPDIVALGGSTLAWYENPGWKKRVISTSKQTPDIISSATADLDGDGKAEIAVAYDFSMNEPKRGKLLMAFQGAKPDDPWTFRPIRDIPSIHRLRWGDIGGRGAPGVKRLPSLVVAPLFGPDSRPPTYDQDSAWLTIISPPEDPATGQWSGGWRIAQYGVLHAIEIAPTPPAWWNPSIRGEHRPGIGPVSASNRLPIPPSAQGGGGMMVSETFVDADGPDRGIYTADQTGVGFIRLDQSVSGRRRGQMIPGGEGSAPKRGSSEVHLGFLADGRRFLATIDPWHGREVAVSIAPGDGWGARYGPRVVLDDTLDDGHALWVADVDGDHNDEVFAGHRGKDARVSVYRLEGQTWNRTVLDSSLTAQDLRGGDLDGDGTPDVVAIGGKSSNVVWFRPVRPLPVDRN